MLKTFSGIRWAFFTVIVFTLLFISPVIAAEKVFDVKNLADLPISLTEYFAVLEDTEKTFTISDIEQPTLAEQFKTDFPASESLNFGFTQSAYWLRFTLKNSSNHPIEPMLELAYHPISNATLYVPDGNSYHTLPSGYSVSLTQRPYDFRLFTFPITLPANSEKTFYLRVASPNRVIVPVRLWQKTAFEQYARKDNMIQALYFGCAITMTLYNLFLFVTLRDKNYLLYVLFSSSASIGLLYYSGSAIEVFSWNDKPEIIKQAVSSITAIIFVWFYLFMRQMFGTAQRFPALDIVIKIFIVANCLLPFSLFFAFDETIKYRVILVIVSTFVAFFSILFCALKRVRSAYFFLAAFSTLFFSISAVSLSSLGLFSVSIISSTWFIQFGSACEMLLLAFALADRYNTLRQEKELTQQQLVEALQTSEHILEMRVAQRTAELEIANRKLQALSMTDGLTGIANRRHFDEVLQTEWIRAKRFKQPLSIGLLDVDWFKKYNDFYGHQMGDECLKTVARVLAENVARTGDLVARYGGEEFVFIAPATDLNTAEFLAEKICQALEVLALPHELSEFGRVSVSIGIATIFPNDTINSDVLLKNADVALYHAKAQGRNRVVTFND